MAPGYQPYVQVNINIDFLNTWTNVNNFLNQTGSPIPASHQASHYASYASITSMPLTPPCSSTSRDNSMVAEGQSDACNESCNGGDNSSQVARISMRENDFSQHNNRIPADHTPIYFLKVFFTPTPLRQWIAQHSIPKWQPILKLFSSTFLILCDLLSPSIMSYLCSTPPLPPSV